MSEEDTDFSGQEKANSFQDMLSVEKNVVGAVNWKTDVEAWTENEVQPGGSTPQL
jgi:hypothetical protein